MGRPVAFKPLKSNPYHYFAVHLICPKNWIVALLWAHRLVPFEILGFFYLFAIAPHYRTFFHPNLTDFRPELEPELKYWWYSSELAYMKNDSLKLELHHCCKQWIINSRFLQTPTKTMLSIFKNREFTSQNSLVGYDVRPNGN